MNILLKSLLAVSAATAVDTHSSWGRHELNPVLRKGPFGPRQAAVKIGIVGGLAVFEYALVKRSKKYEKPFVYTNFVAAGVTGAVAARNYRVKPLPRFK